MNGGALVGATFITGTAAVSRVVVFGVTATTDGDINGTFASMGVFGSGLVIAYFMLKRGDKREADMKEENVREIERLRVEIGGLTERQDAADRRLIDALVENARLRAAIESALADPSMTPKKGHTQ